MVRVQEVPRLTISELAREGVVGIETIRFYQRRGLLDAPERGGTGVRHYGEEDVRRLRFIRSAKVAGFTLHEIGELLALDATEDRPRARAMARTRLAALDAQIADLEAARASLRRLARECGSASHGPCPILKSFESV